MAEIIASWVIIMAEIVLVVTFIRFCHRWPVYRRWALLEAMEGNENG